MAPILDGKRALCGKYRDWFACDMVWLVLQIAYSTKPKAWNAHPGIYMSVQLELVMQKKLSIPSDKTTSRYARMEKISGNFNIECHVEGHIYHRH